MIEPRLLTVPELAELRRATESDAADMLPRRWVAKLLGHNDALQARVAELHDQLTAARRLLAETRPACGGHIHE